MWQHVRKGAGLLLVLCLVTGCAMLNGNYGSIVPDQAADREFAAFRLDPNMNYYYSGPDYYPNALIGLKKEYVLDNDLWKSLEPDPKIFKDKIRSMQDSARVHHTLQYGFAIKDPQGKTIGVWYSILNLKTMVVKMGAGNKVIIYTPELEIYEHEPSGSGDGQTR